MKFLALTLLALANHAWAADELSVLTAMNIPMSKYGISWQSPQIRLRVKNLAYDKSIRVVFIDSEGQSSFAQASYLGPADSGYEVWEAFGNIRSGGPVLFQVDYAVAGRSFSIDRQELKNGPILYQGQNIEQVLTAHQLYGDRARFVAAVRNIAYQKHVSVHYSCDDFNSEYAAFLDFVPFFMYGYGSVSSPTPYGFEMWSSDSVPVPDGCSTLRYYYTYEVNGAHYADTNYGHNYVMNRN